MNDQIKIDIKKVRKVIGSCLTDDHLVSANKLFNLLNKKWASEIIKCDWLKNEMLTLTARLIGKRRYLKSDVILYFKIIN